MRARAVDRLPALRSGAPRPGGERQGAKSSQGVTELGLPRPAPGKMQCEEAGRSGEPSGEGEEAPPQGLGGHHLLAETDARRPAGQVVSNRLDRQPSGVGCETAGREMVETDAVLEVADGVLDLGVAAVVCLEIQGVAIPVGDEGVIAVGGEEGQLRAGRGLHPPDDEPHRCGAGLTLEGGVEPVSEVEAHNVNRSSWSPSALILVSDRLFGL